MSGPAIFDIPRRERELLERCRDCYLESLRFPDRVEYAGLVMNPETRGVYRDLVVELRRGVGLPRNFLARPTFKGEPVLESGDVVVWGVLLVLRVKP